jgi:hypothetical protein
MKKNFALLLFVLLILIVSCEKQKDTSTGEIVINELMPVNSTTVSDQNGEFDDWIELYNPSSQSMDISGYHLSDKKSNLSKWSFPQGITVSGKGFLIVWADSDTTQPGLHANFKLSSSGETVSLSKPGGSLIDQVSFSAQTLELSFSRYPDGTGEFRWQIPTFNSTNNNVK